MPGAIQARLTSSLPKFFNEAAIARSYNLVTGANWSHLDIRNLGVFDLDEVLLLVDNSGLIH